MKVRSSTEENHYALCSACELCSCSQSSVLLCFASGDFSGQRPYVVAGHNSKPDYRIIFINKPIFKDDYLSLNNFCKLFILSQINFLTFNRLILHPSIDMTSTGQTINDRINAVRYALVGQGLARAVCKATTEEVLGPKKKHIDCEYNLKLITLKF